MPKVIFIQDDGTRVEVEGEVGDSLMEIAVANNVDGIEADCGGSCMCATCHCFIGESDLSKFGTMSDDENEMLDSAAVARKPTSRLSCQLTMSAELDGIEVRLPSEQS